MVTRSSKLFAFPVILCAVGLVAAQAAPRQDVPPDVAYRQSVMQGLRAHTGAIRAIANGSVPHQGHLVEHARAVQDLAVMMGDVFPEGSGGEASDTRDDLWDRWDAFQEKLTAFQQATVHLTDAAESGDAEALREAASEVTQGCRGCHGEFRKED